MADASILVKLGLKSSGFKEDMKSALMSVERLKFGLRKLSNGLKVSVKFLADSTMAASDVSESMNLMGLTFGKNKEEVLGWADTVAEATGRSKFEVAGMATEFQAVLGPMMKSKDAAKEFSKGLAQLSLDVSSARNIPEQMALEKLRAGIIGEIEPLRSLGVVMSQASLQAFAYAQGQNKLLAEMTEAEKVALRYQFIMEGMSDIQGDAANTSDQFANRLRSLGSVKNDLMIIIGQSLMPVLNIMMGTILELGRGMIRNAATIHKWIKNGWEVLFYAMHLGVRLLQGMSKQWDAMKIVGMLAVNGLLMILRGLLVALQMVTSPFELIFKACEKLGLIAPDLSGAYEGAFAKIDSAIESTAIKSNNLVDSFGENAKKVGELADGVAKMNHEAQVSLENNKKAAVEVKAPLEEVAAIVTKSNETSDETKKKLEAEMKARQDMAVSAVNSSARMGDAIGSALAAGNQQHEIEKTLLKGSVDVLRQVVMKKIRMWAAQAAASQAASMAWAGPIVAGGAAAVMFGLVESFLTKFHQGGVVRKDQLVSLPGMSSSEGLAVLSEGETVLPAGDKGGGSGGGVNVTYQSVFPQTRAEVDTFVDTFLVPALKRREMAGAF